MKQIAGRHALMKRINRALILELLRKNDMVTRLQLADQTGLDPKTITNFVRELIEEGIVLGGGYEESTGGRKREKLMLNDDARLFVGIDIGASHITGILTNLKGHIKEKLTEKIDETITTEELQQRIITICGSLCNSARKDHTLFGMGVVAPGVLNPECTQWVHCANIHALDNIPLKTLLEEQCEVPVYLEDCSRASGLAEKWFGLATERPDFLTLDLGVGIGLGIFFNNKLFRGESGAAGEIGHSTVIENGDLCSCGKYGCLETLASVPALLQYYRSLTNHDSAKQPLSMEIMLQKAQDKDQAAQSVYKRYGEYLGVAVSNLVNVLDPGLIIIAGGIALARNFMEQPFLEAIRENSITFRSIHTEILWSEFPLDASALGAAVLPLQEFYNPSPIA